MSVKLFVALFAAIAMVAFGILAFTARRDTIPPGDSMAISAPVDGASTAIQTAPDPAPRRSVGFGVMESAIIDTDKASVLATLEQAAITYDPAQLPLIAVHLDSSDPEVRAAAVDAVMLLGDSSGAVLLRQAAARAREAGEAARLRAKADYLELPPASLLTPEEAAAIRARIRPQSAAPGP